MLKFISKSRPLRQSSSTTSTIIDSISFLLAKASTIGVRLFALYLCASHITTAKFGPIALGFTCSELVRLVFDWGTDTWSLRRFSSPSLEVAEKTLGFVVRQKIYASTGSLFCAFLLVHYLSGISTFRLALATALFAPTSMWINTSVLWCQGRNNIRKVAILLAFLSIASLLLQYALYKYSIEGELQIIALSISECLIACALYYNIIRPKVRLYNQSLFTQDKNEWLNEATPIAFASIVALTYGRFDQFYVSHQFPPSVLGEYMFAIKLTDPFLYVAAAFYSTIYARVAKIIQGGDPQGELAKNAKKWPSFLFLYGLACLVGVELIFNAMRETVWPLYKAAGSYVLAALIALIFRSLNLCLTALIQAAGRYVVMLKINLTNCLVICVAVMLLGRYFGPVGCAYGAVIGECVNSVMQTVVLRRVVKDFRRCAGRPF